VEKRNDFNGVPLSQKAKKPKSQPLWHGGYNLGGTILAYSFLFFFFLLYIGGSLAF
jgi:hypothetical protein